MAKAVSEIMLILLLLSMLGWMSDTRSATTKNNLEKTLVFEEDFEGEIAPWWNEIRGTPTLSTEKAHSGNYSHVTDEDEEGLIYWFNSSITNEVWEFEVWFYDNMSGPATSIIGTGWAPGQVLGMVIWYGSDYENFYAYRYGESITPVLDRIPRSVGWHRANLVHEPEKASIFIDEILLVQINESVSFNRFFIGDYWSGFSSYVHYDSIRMWKYTVPVEYSFLTIDETIDGTTDPAPGTYSYIANTTVQVTAVPNVTYAFNHWELDNVDIGSDNPCTVLMDRNHTLKAIFVYVPPPLTVYINPIKASIRTGSSLALTSTVKGGLPPYTYQWYLNSNLVQNESGSNWVFKPIENGLHHIFVNITDSVGNTKQSKIVDVSSQINYETETITTEAITDAYVASLTTSSGVDNDLQVGNFYMTSSIAYILFDLSKIPPGATIDSAALKLKVSFFSPEWNRWVTVFRASSGWNETGLNWSNKPYIGKMLATSDINFIEDWCSWEHWYLTEAVEEALSQRQNLSIALKSYFLSDMTGLFLFYSRESGEGPQLEVTYTPDTTPPSIGSVNVQPFLLTPNDEITFRVNVSDDHSGVKEVWLCYSINSGNDWNKLLMTLDKDSYKVAIPKQAEGTTILYYFETFDNALNKAQSNNYSCTVNAITLIKYILITSAIIASIIVSIIIVRKRRQSTNAEEREKLAEQPKLSLLIYPFQSF